jgi:excisionase family DNA binding protein
LGKLLCHLPRDGSVIAVTEPAVDLVIPPATVAINPRLESDWARAVYQFVTEASQAGKTVRVSAEEKTFTPRETGQILGISRSAIQRHIAAGRVRTIMKGSYHRVPESEVERLRQSIRSDVLDLFANDF